MTDEGRKAAASEYSKAFRKYLRCGMDAELALQQNPDLDGGYHVPPSMADRIMQKLWDNSPLRHLAAVETITADALIIKDDGGVNRVIPTHELYAQPKATQKLVEDSSIDIESWLVDKIADIFSRKENEAFVHGTSVEQPHGILHYAEAGRVEAIHSGVNGEVTTQGVMSLIRSFPDLKNAAFVMNRLTVQSVRLLQDPATKNYLWQPGLSAGAPDTLAGVPVHTVNDMPEAARGALAVAVGDFRRGYRIVDKAGIRILRDPFTERPFVKFYAAKRVGGDVIECAAIKCLRLAE